jgi:hypothetical protein
VSVGSTDGTEGQLVLKNIVIIHWLTVI